MGIQVTMCDSAIALLNVGRGARGGLYWEDSCSSLLLSIFSSLAQLNFDSAPSLTESFAQLYMDLAEKSDVSQETQV